MAPPLFLVAVSCIYAAKRSSPPPLPVSELSQRYRNWSYFTGPYSGFVVPPSAGNFSGQTLVDTAVVFEKAEEDSLPGRWRMTYLFFNATSPGYEAALATSDDLLHWDFGRGGERGVVFRRSDVVGAFDYGGVTLGGMLFASYNMTARRRLKKSADGFYYALYGCYPSRSGYEAGNGGEGVARSADGVTWSRVSATVPILSGGSSALAKWESQVVYQPFLLEVPGNGSLIDFYNAKGINQFGHTAEESGLANLDRQLPGISGGRSEWVRNAASPVLPSGAAGAADTYQAADPKVFWDEEQQVWVMLYFGLGDGTHGHACIMAAFSRDLLRWEKDPEPLYRAGGHPAGIDAQHAHKVSIIFDDRGVGYLYYTAVGPKGRGIALLTSVPVQAAVAAPPSSPSSPRSALTQRRVSGRRVSEQEEVQVQAQEEGGERERDEQEEGAEEAEAATGARIAAPTPAVRLFVNTSNINSQRSRGVTASGQDGQWVIRLGHSDDLSACGELCAAWSPTTARAAAWAALVSDGGDLRCRSFTRYTASFAPNASLAGQCFGHLDLVWLPLPVVGADSGFLEWPCTSDMDCSLNGHCADTADAGASSASSRRCDCGPGWVGSRCERLKLAPVNPAVLGFDPSDGGRNLSSWGGSVQQVDGTWHMWAVLLANHCGIGSYLLNSQVVHAVSEGGVEGPYRRVDVVLPPFAHEPVVVRAPTGELVLASVAGPLGKYSPCSCSTGATSPHCNSCNNSCHPQTPTLSWTAAVGGPWESRPMWDGARGENPSIWITNNGTLVGMGRGGMAGTASDWRNARTWRSGVPGTLISSAPDAEDPMLYQDERGRFHALLHNLEGQHMCGDSTECLVGIHIYSRDGVVWLNGGVAYTSSVSLTTGGELRLNRRERPHLIFAEGTRRPVALSTSAQIGGATGDRSFTLVQKLTGV